MGIITVKYIIEKIEFKFINFTCCTVIYMQCFVTCAALETERGLIKNEYDVTKYDVTKYDVTKHDVTKHDVTKQM